MKNFTKTYNVQPNEKQRSSMNRAFKAEIIHELTQGHKVEVLVNDFESKIIVSIIVNGNTQTSRIIGVNGGLTVL